MFDLSHVFRRRAAEKDLSQQALVAGLTANSLHSITTSPIRLRSSLGSKGQVGPRHNYREKHRSSTKCLAFEIKENAANIAEYRRKKTCFKSFFLFSLFFFLAQKVGTGAQKSGGAAALPAPPPPRSLLQLNF